MMGSSSLAVEGLPGAGKSSLISTMAMLFPQLAVLPELVLPLPRQPDARYFAANDLAKIKEAAELPCVLLDRTWFSTVAYVVAQERLCGASTCVREVVDDLYATPPGLPDVCLFIDSPTALALGFAHEGLFPQVRFRALLRAAYLEIFSTFTSDKLTHCVSDNSVKRAIPGIQQAFGQQWNARNR